MRCLSLPDPFECHQWTGTGLVENYHVLSPYCEVFWLPHVGPSTYLLARRLASGPGPWPKADLAAALGLGGTGLNSTLERSLARLESFRLAAVVDDTLLLRHLWPRLPERLLTKLPESLRLREARLAAA